MMRYCEKANLKRHRKIDVFNLVNITIGFK